MSRIVSIIYQEHFERSSVHNAFSYLLILEQFNDIILLNNMAFIMFILHFYLWFGHFCGYLNGHNNEFLVVRYAYVYTFPFLVRTVYVLKMNFLILIGNSYSSVLFFFVSMSHIFNFINFFGVYFDLIGYIELQCLIRFILFYNV